MSDPCGNRTRPSSLRGWCPEPIDERALQWVVKELNLSSSTLLVLRQRLYRPPQRAQPDQWHRRESNPQTRRFELRRSASWRTVPQASPTGFEPVISCVTGRRALQAAPRGRIVSSKVAQVGLEPTASLVLSQSGLPLPTEPMSQCPRPESNRHPRGFKPCRSANWRTWAKSPAAASAAGEIFNRGFP